ncbi:MAG: ribonuclease HII [Methanobacteriota archaeon]
MLVAGVDEAGRGPVLGPMVVAAVTSDSPHSLRAAGVKDSKLLSPAARAKVAKDMSPFVKRARVLIIPPDELDRRMATTSLNRIEAEAFATLVADLAPDVAYLDAADVDEGRFARRVLGRLNGTKVRLVSRHKADAKYPIVAAASVLAKVMRDAEIAKIQQEFDLPIGSGYCHDPLTQRFLDTYVKEHGTLPPHARAAWATSRRLARREARFF